MTSIGILHYKLSIHINSAKTSWSKGGIRLLAFLICLGHKLRCQRGLNPDEPRYCHHQCLQKASRRPQLTWIPPHHLSRCSWCRGADVFQRNPARRLGQHLLCGRIFSHEISRIFKALDMWKIVEPNSSNPSNCPQISGTVQQCRFRIFGAPWKRRSKKTVHWRPVFIGIGLQPWLKALFPVVSGTDRDPMMITNSKRW